MVLRNLKIGVFHTLFSTGNGRRSRVVRRTSQLASAVIATEKLENRELLTADSVTAWNEVLLDAIRVEKPAPPVASRAMAIVHTAIFDAVNSIDRKYEPYHVQIPGGAGAAIDAAVASAARRTLATLFPARQADFDAAYTSTLATVPDGPSETKGIQIGNSVADQILALRSADGSSAVVSYTPGMAPGEWRPTPTGFASAVLPQWPNVTPFGLNSGSQFRPAAPPALTSAEYAADLAQVRELGSSTSSTRTADQTDIAKFWAGGPGTATPPGEWNMIAQAVTETHVSTTVENARLFALLNISLADAAIAAWDAKYEYNLWRPITAIREADSDGNAATVQDATWTPLLNTPAFPSYTSGHSTFSGAAAAVLQDFYGMDDISFELASEVAGVANRSFTSFSDAAAEAGFSRIYGGIHYNFDNTTALNAGDSVGRFVTDSLLRPVTRINAGGPELTDGTWFTTDPAFQNGVGIPFRTTAPINMSGVPGGLSPKLFQTNLWDAAGGQELKFRIPTVNGATYRVDLFFSEIWAGAFRRGARKFDVAVEGQMHLNNLDIFSEAGANKALMKSFEVTSDGTLNIDFLHRVQNPTIAGIQITELSPPANNMAPVISQIADQTMNGGSTISVPFTVMDPENRSLTVSASAADPNVVTNVSITGTGNNRTLVIKAGTALGATDVTVTVSDGTHTVTETLKVTASLRLNGGGGQISATPAFLPDRSYRRTGIASLTWHAINMSAVPAGIPAAVFQSNVFSPARRAQMGFSIPLQAGGRYRVDLLFSEIWSGAFGVGRRVFDVKLDGVLKLHNFDIFAEAGANKGLVKSFEIISDGNLNIDLSHGIQNPTIAGIQITRLASVTPI